MFVPCTLQNKQVILFQVTPDLWAQLDRTENLNSCTDLDSLKYAILVLGDSWLSREYKSELFFVFGNPTHTLFNSTHVNVPSKTSTKHSAVLSKLVSVSLVGG